MERFPSNDDDVDCNLINFNPIKLDGVDEDDDVVGGGGGKKRKNSVPSIPFLGPDDSYVHKRRFVWSDALHRDFISAVFDIGLKTATVRDLNEMLPPNATSNGEVYKALLQKFRVFRDRKLFPRKFFNELESSNDSIMSNTDGINKHQQIPSSASSQASWQSQPMSEDMKTSTTQATLPPSVDNDTNITELTPEEASQIEHLTTHCEELQQRIMSKLHGISQAIYEQYAFYQTLKQSLPRQTTLYNTVIGELQSLQPHLSAVGMKITPSTPGLSRHSSFTMSFSRGNSLKSTTSTSSHHPGSTPNFATLFQSTSHSGRDTNNNNNNNNANTDHFSPPPSLQPPFTSVGGSNNGYPSLYLPLLDSITPLSMGGGLTGPLTGPLTGGHEPTPAAVASTPNSLTVMEEYLKAHPHHHYHHGISHHPAPQSHHSSHSHPHGTTYSHPHSHPHPLHTHTSSPTLHHPPPPPPHTGIYAPPQPPPSSTTSTNPMTTYSTTPNNILDHHPLPPNHFDPLSSLPLPSSSSTIPGPNTAAAAAAAATGAVTTNTTGGPATGTGGGGGGQWEIIDEMREQMSLHRKLLVQQKNQLLLHNGNSPTNANSQHGNGTIGEEMVLPPPAYRPPTEPLTSPNMSYVEATPAYTTSSSSSSFCPPVYSNNGQNSSTSSAGYNIEQHHLPYTSSSPTVYPTTSNTLPAPLEQTATAPTDMQSYSNVSNGTPAPQPNTTTIDLDAFDTDIMDLFSFLDNTNEV